jgi:hypothetical protein
MQPLSRDEMRRTLRKVPSPLEELGLRMVSLRPLPVGGGRHLGRQVPDIGWGAVRQREVWLESFVVRMLAR